MGAYWTKPLNSHSKILKRNVPLGLTQGTPFYAELLGHQPVQDLLSARAVQLT